jgi:hypothetical protein
MVVKTSMIERGGRRTSYPSPLWGGWLAEGQSGGGTTTEAVLGATPTPASASLGRPSPQGGGIS